MSLSPSRIQECIRICQLCAVACDTALFTYCLEKGGEHLAPAHVRMMMDCVAICRTAVDMMQRGTVFHEIICHTCAVICEACAKSCEELKDSRMLYCAETCRKCASLCRQIHAMDG